MASLTSFESYFGNVFNAAPESRKHKVKKQNTAYHAHKPLKLADFETNQKDEKQKNKNQIGGIKISSYKLKHSKAHRKNSINAKKNQLQSNLISLGYNPQNMSLMKQRKLFDKAMKELSSRKNPKDEDKNEKKVEDILSFMKDNDLFIDDTKTPAPQKPQTSTKKQTKAVKDSMDIEFGDVLKPDYKKEVDEETFVRTGKTNKDISDRQLLKSLKKRDKVIKRKYHNRVHIDDHLANNVMKKLKGEKVKGDLKYMKNKLRQKYKKKLRSRKQWKQRLARKEYGRNKKLDRRDANIAAYRDKKVANRMKNRITTQQAIATANL